MIWEEFALGMMLPLDEATSIIDDALCHGFTFKVENHTIYWTDVI